MKISCLQESLARGLAIVGRGVATRSTLPITECVLVKTSEGMLQLTANNLESSVTAWVAAIIEEEGAAAIPYRRFADLINSLPATKVEIDLLTPEEADGEEAGPGSVASVARIKCDRSVTHLNTAAAKDFPPEKAIDSGRKVKLDTGQFKNAVSMTQFAVSRKRPGLQGILMEFADDGLTMVGADGFRLAIHKQALAHDFEERTKLVTPLRTMLDVQRLAGDQSGPIEMTVAEDEGSVRFKMDEGTITSQLVKTDFPDHASLVPQSFTTAITMEVEDFKSAVQTANVFAKDGSKIIRMEMDPKERPAKSGRMRVSARSEQAGDNTREIDLDRLEGDAGKIAFNSEFLQEICNAMSKGKIEFEMTTATSPGVVRYADSEVYTHIMMPMKTEWGDEDDAPDGSVTSGQADEQGTGADPDVEPSGETQDPPAENEADREEEEPVDSDEQDGDSEVDAESNTDEDDEPADEDNAEADDEPADDDSDEDDDGDEDGDEAGTERE